MTEEILDTIDSRKEQGFDIVCYALPEDVSPRGQGADIIKKINNGALQWFVVKVTASKNGIELASDYLGGCCYEKFLDFIEQDDYYSDMRATVIKEAQEAINGLNA